MSDKHGPDGLAVPFVRDRSHEGQMPMSAPEPVVGERADLLQSLARQRHFLRHSTRGLTDEQAAQQTTASELSGRADQARGADRAGMDAVHHRWPLRDELG